MPTVSAVDGVRIAVHELGGSGPTMLLDHATGFHGYVWAPLAKRLAERYHPIAFDHRAHGDSGRPGDFDALTWDDLASDTAAVVDGLDLAQPLALGHSMGGACLLVNAAARPGMFRAIAVFEPVVIPPDPRRAESPNPLAESARRRRADFASYEEAEANYARKPPLSDLRSDALAAYVRHGLRLTDSGVTLKCRPEDEARVFESARLHRSWEVLDQVKCPVLVLRGVVGDDGVAQHSAAVAERLPRGELFIFDDLGHLGPMEQPEAVADVVARFFAAHT